MNAPVKVMSFAMACKDYFGLQPAQTLMEFSAELKALTEKDRADLKAEFAKIGYTIH